MSPPMTTNLASPTHSTPQGLAWNYRNNSAALMSEQDFDKRTVTHGPEAAGRLIARTDALRHTIRHERDELDRIISKNAHSKVTTFTYDIFDRMPEALAPDEAVTYLRDRHGRLKSETTNGRTVSYTHDQLGRRTSRTTPGPAVGAAPPHSRPGLRGGTTTHP